MTFRLQKNQLAISQMKIKNRKYSVVFVYEQRSKEILFQIPIKHFNAIIQQLVTWAWLPLIVVEKLHY